MAGRIPRPFIDDLLNRIDIVDVVGERVPLKKAGKDFHARCPFHDEKTPSFTVSQSKQFYHCFGCGAHGTAIGFVMEYDRLDFPSAVEALAERAGLEVPREESLHRGPDSRPLYEMLERCARFFQSQLRHHPQASRAVDYLKGRGVDGPIASAFGIGYAPPAWDHLLRHLGEDPTSRETLEASGMLAVQEQRQYDRFRDRIMFPIRDRRGRIVGFGGRLLGDGKPKYLNSPETSIFHKGQEVYGLYEARKACRQPERLLIVEGYMDVIALAQHGIPYAVATLGTVATGEHVEQLFRIAPELVFCFDGDQAGREAAWKALITSLPLLRDGREARFLLLPQGEDPDTQVRKEGAERFERRIRNATPLSDFLFDAMTQGIDLRSEDGRARLAAQTAPLLQKLPEGVFRDLMFQRLETLVALAPGRLQPSTHGTKPAGRRRIGTRRPARATPVRIAIALLTQHPELAPSAAECDPAWRRLEAPGITLLWELLDLLTIEPNLKTAALVERWRDSEHFEALQRLAAAELEVPAQGREQELRGAIRQLTERYRDQELERLLERARGSTLGEEEKERLKAILAQRSEEDAGKRLVDN